MSVRWTKRKPAEASTLVTSSLPLQTFREGRSRAAVPANPPARKLRRDTEYWLITSAFISPDSGSATREIHLLKSRGLIVARFRGPSKCRRISKIDQFLLTSPAFVRLVGRM